MVSSIFGVSKEAGRTVFYGNGGSYLSSKDCYNVEYTADSDVTGIKDYVAPKSVPGIRSTDLTSPVTWDGSDINGQFHGLFKGTELLAAWSSCCEP